MSPDTCTLSGCEEQTETRATVTGLRPVGCEMNQRGQHTLSPCYTHTNAACVYMCVCERQGRAFGRDKKLSNTVVQFFAALIKAPQEIKSVRICETFSLAVSISFVNLMNFTFVRDFALSTRTQCHNWFLFHIVQIHWFINKLLFKYDHKWTQINSSRGVLARTTATAVKTRTQKCVLLIVTWLAYLTFTESELKTWME